MGRGGRPSFSLGLQEAFSTTQAPALFSREHRSSPAREGAADRHHKNHPHHHNKNIQDAGLGTRYDRTRLDSTVHVRGRDMVDDILSMLGEILELLSLIFFCPYLQHCSGRAKKSSGSGQWAEKDERFRQSTTFVWSREPDGQTAHRLMLPPSLSVFTGVAFLICPMGAPSPSVEKSQNHGEHLEIRS